MTKFSEEHLRTKWWIPKNDGREVPTNRNSRTAGMPNGSLRLWDFVECYLALNPAPTGANIYNTSDSLTGDRVVTMGNSNLTFNAATGDFVVGAVNGGNSTGFSVRDTQILLANTIAGDSSQISMAAPQVVISSSDGVSSSAISVQDQGLEFLFTGNADWKLDGNPGTLGQVPISQGADSAPIWGNAPFSFTLDGNGGATITINNGDALNIVGGLGILTNENAGNFEIDLNATIDDLLDVDASGAVNNGILVYNSTSGNWEAGPPPVTIATSVDIDGDQGSVENVTDGDTITFTGGLGIDTTVGAPETITIDLAANLDDLQDVAAAGAINGNILVHNGTSWILGTLPTGTGSMNSFTLLADGPLSSPQVIEDTNVLFVTGGTGITANSQATDTLDIILTANINDLLDVNSPAPNNGDILVFNNATSEWTPQAPAATGVTSFDVSGNIGATQTIDNINNLLRIEGTNSNIVTDGVNTGLITITWSADLNDLSDVNTAGVQAGDILEFNGTTWIPGTAGMFSFTIEDQDANQDQIDDQDILTFAHQANSFLDIIVSTGQIDFNVPIPTTGGTDSQVLVFNDNTDTYAWQSFTVGGSTWTIADTGSNTSDISNGDTLTVSGAGIVNVTVTQDGDAMTITGTETDAVVTTDGTALGVSQSGTANHTIDITLLSGDANNDLSIGADGGLFFEQAAATFSMDLTANAGPTETLNSGDTLNIVGDGVNTDTVVSSPDTITINWNADLTDLNDVVITTPTNGQILLYDGANWINGAGAFLSEWRFDGDLGAEQSINLAGNLLQFRGGNGLATTAGVPDRLTIDFETPAPQDGTARVYQDDGSGTFSWIPTPTSGGPSMTFTLRANSGGDQLIEDGNIMEIFGGTNITTNITGTDRLTIDWSADLNDLGDVTITTPAINDVLTFNGSIWVNQPSVAGMTSFFAAANLGTPHEIEDGETLTITPGIGFSTVTLAGNILQVGFETGPTLGTTDKFVYQFDDDGDTFSWVDITTLGGMNDFQVSGNAGSNETVGDGDVLNIVGDGTIINTTISAPDTVTIAWSADIEDLNNVAVTAPTNGQILVYNNVSGQWENSDNTAGTMDTFFAAGDTGSQEIGNGDTLTIASRQGLVTEAVATDTVEVGFESEPPADSVSRVYVRTSGGPYLWLDVSTFGGFILRGDSGPTQGINTSDQMQIYGGEGFSTVTSNTDVLTINFSTLPPTGTSDSYVYQYNDLTGAFTWEDVTTLTGGYTRWRANPDSGVSLNVTDDYILNIQGGPSGTITTTSSSPAQLISIDWSAGINDLNDVTITTPSNGEVLTYQGGVWINEPVPTGMTSFFVRDLFSGVDEVFDTDIIEFDAGRGLNHFVVPGSPVKVRTDFAVVPPENGVERAFIDLGTGIYEWRALSALGSGWDIDDGTNPPQTISGSNDLLVTTNANLTATVTGTGPTELNLGWSASLQDLGNVIISSPSSGDVIEFDGLNWVNVAGGSGGGMTNFEISGNGGSNVLVEDGEVININGGTGITTSGTGASNLLTIALTAELNDLLDVTAPLPTNGQVLTYSGGAWIPAAASGGGSMDTFDVAGNSGTQTISNLDTLVIQGTGGNITTAAVASDTINITWSAIISDLLDVNAGGANTNDVLTFNGAQWVASAPTGGTDTNFAANNLTFTGNRTHNVAGNQLFITNADRIRFNASANPSSDIQMVTQNIDFAATSDCRISTGGGGTFRLQTPNVNTATASVNDQLTLLSTTAGSTFGDSDWAAPSSDERIKKDIVDSVWGLDTIKQLPIKEFTYTFEEHPEWERNVLAYEGQRALGIIAQEVEELNIPNFVHVTPSSLRKVDYNTLVPVLVKAVQELSTRVEELENELN